MSRFIDANAYIKYCDEHWIPLNVDAVKAQPTADVVPTKFHDKCMQIEIEKRRNMVEVVRCKDCKYRIVNEHYGEDGYMKLKAICDKDTGDPFELGRNAEDDEWFCADAERREDDGL